MNSFILADGRWQGLHGIGRFSHEVISRLKNTDILLQGPSPLSLHNIIWQARQLRENKHRYKIFFNPGYHPVLFSSIPYVLTIHDLIHLHVPGKAAIAKKIYYELLVKPSIKNAYKVLTVSDYSKKNIMEWANIPEDKIVVVGNGVNHCFTKDGTKHQPGYPYLLHVGNTKPHKNVARLMTAFATAKIDPQLKLILTGKLTPELTAIIQKNNLQNRIVFTEKLSDEQLAEYYRGATAFILPSLIEGFGIPVIEAMACGTPVLISDATSLPEIGGDAALLVDPYSIDSITHGIERITHDSSLRTRLTTQGNEQVKLFSWDKTAEKVQKILDV